MSLSILSNSKGLEAWFASITKQAFFYTLTLHLKCILSDKNFMRTFPLLLVPSYTRENGLAYLSSRPRAV